MYLVVHLNLQKYDKAIDTYKLGISIDNSFVNIYFNWVKAYIYSGEFKKASSTILGINNEMKISSVNRRMKNYLKRHREKFYEQEK